MKAEFFKAVCPLEIGDTVAIKTTKDGETKEALYLPQSCTVITTAAVALHKVTDIATLHYLKKGETPEQILEILLGNLGLEITSTMPAKFYCNCSKERVEKAVISVGKKEIQDMIDDGQDIEVKCHFCNTAYKYSVEELKDILKRCKR